MKIDKGRAIYFITIKANLYFEAFLREEQNEEKAKAYFNIKEGLMLAASIIEGLNDD